MKNVTVEITQDDINRAKTRKLVKGSYCQSCPVALALSRALGYQCAVSAESWWRPGISYTMKPLSHEIRTFINNFDCGHDVQPIIFTIEAD